MVIQAWEIPFSYSLQNARRCPISPAIRLAACLAVHLLSQESKTPPMQISQKRCRNRVSCYHDQTVVAKAGIQSKQYHKINALHLLCPVSSQSCPCNHPYSAAPRKPTPSLPRPLAQRIAQRIPPQVTIRAPLALVLDLVVARNSLRIRRRGRALARPGSGGGRRSRVVGVRSVGHVRLSRWGLGGLAASRSSAAAGAWGGSALLLLVVVAHEHVGYAAVAALGLVAVLVVVFGKFRDDVPCVEDSWDLVVGERILVSLRRLGGGLCGRGILTTPRKQRRMLMIESAEQIPHLTQTLLLLTRDTLVNIPFVLFRLLVKATHQATK